MQEATSTHHVVYSPAELCGRKSLSEPPITVGDNVELAYESLSLDEAIAYALENSELVRSSGGTSLLDVARSASAFDPAIQDANFLFGQRGYAAALSDFDTQVAVSSTWGRNEAIQNNTFLSGGVLPGDTLVEETNAFRSQLSKNLRRGGQFSVSHDWDYNGSNRSDLLFPSVYTGATRFQFRQPLLAGRGRDVTDTVGPSSNSVQGITGVTQGVAIAKINAKISVLDFELAVSQLLRDVEAAYWALFEAHALLNEINSQVDRMQDIATSLEARVETGGLGAGTVELSEVQQTVLQLEMQRNNQLNQIMRVDAELRKLLRLPLKGSVAFVPVDKPSTAPVSFDWFELVSTAESNRPELRRQSLEISSLRRQVNAAENLARPRVDFVSSYQVNGFGDQLSGPRGPIERGSAYGRLYEGDETGWSMGFQMTQTVGRRFQHARIRNLQLQLAKATGVLNEQAADLEKELAIAVREVDRTRGEIRLSQEIDESAVRSREANEARFQSEGDALSLLTWLRAEQRSLQSRIASVSSTAAYARALSDLQFRSGTLLSLNCMSVSASGGEVTWEVKSCLKRDRSDSRGSR